MKIVCKEEESTCERGVPEGDGRGTACSPAVLGRSRTGDHPGARHLPPAQTLSLSLGQEVHEGNLHGWAGLQAAPAPSHSRDGRGGGGGVLNEKERRGGMPGCNWLSGRVLVSAQVLISRS